MGSQKMHESYDLLSNNCVSKTIAGAKAGGSKSTFSQKRYYNSPYSSLEYTVPIRTPSELQYYLQNCSKQRNSNIKDVTKEMIKVYD